MFLLRLVAIPKHQLLARSGAPTVLPRELSLDQATAVQGLHGLDDVEVLDGDLGVLLEVEAVQGVWSVRVLWCSRFPCDDPYSFAATRTPSRKRAYVLKSQP